MQGSDHMPGYILHLTAAKMYLDRLTYEDLKVFDLDGLIGFLQNAVLTF